MLFLYLLFLSEKTIFPIIQKTIEENDTEEIKHTPTNNDGDIIDDGYSILDE